MTHPTLCDRLVLIAAVLGLALGAAGCRRLALPDAQTRQQLAQLRYPDAADRGPVLDIVVVRRGNTIRLVNRSPRPIEGRQLWLNQQYVRRVDRIAIGDNPPLNLATFINRHGEPYPVGTLLAPDADLRLVLAELYDPDSGEIRSLSVQPSKRDLEP